MAQIPEKGLSTRVLPVCNFGSRVVPAARGGKKQAKGGRNEHQIEQSGFTQSWIVVVHCSRAGNVR
jgi:hypothetical protein